MTLKRRNYGKGHSYTADGIKLPGVTTILQQAPKPALIDWAGRTTAEYAIDHWDELAELPPSARLKILNGARFAERDAAARRGTQVHALAELLVDGSEVDVPDLLRGHVESYVKFLDQFDPDPVAIELVVCNREIGYCGSADLVAHMDGVITLLELKTSRSGIFPESALQACAYARSETYTLPGDDGAERPLAELGIERCVAVHIRGDGYDVRPLDTGDETWAYFRHLAWMHAHDDSRQEWVGEAEQPAAAVA